MVLAAAGSLGIPYWLVNPLLSTLAVWLLFLLSREIADEKVALITAGCVVCSPFFVFNGASFFSHTSTLVFVLLFYYHGIRHLETKRTFTGYWLDYGLDASFLARPFTAILMSAPLILWFLFLLPWRSYWKGVLFLAGASPAFIFYLVYNDLITGDPFLPVTTWKAPNEGLGFIRGHNPTLAMRHSIRLLKEFHNWAPASILLLSPPTLWLGLRWPHKWTLMLWLTFASMVIGYAFYWSLGGNRYGPRFYFEAFPFIVLSVTAIVFGSGLRNPGQRILQAIYGFGCAIALFNFIGHTTMEHRIVDKRLSLYRLVEREGIENAVIYVASSTAGPRYMNLGDLLRNGINRTNSVLYVRDLGPGKKQKLMAFYSGRDFYRYSRKKGEITGSLEYIENPNTNPGKMIPRKNRVAPKAGNRGR